jgi:alpha-tubulin suppressor-like RCC1 family protein
LDQPKFVFGLRYSIPEIMSRRRSSSLTEKAPAAGLPSREALEATHELWELLYYSLEDPRSGQTVLHWTDNASMVRALLDRAHQLDHFSRCHAVSDNSNKSSESPSSSSKATTSLLQSSNWLASMLLQCDRESGYTPLHWAVLKAKLPVLLLLLRYCASFSSSSGESNRAIVEEFTPVMSNRSSYRPLSLLQGDVSNLGDQARTILTAVDGEGLTAFQLVERLQTRELEKCRQSLVFNPLLGDPSTEGAASERDRRNSFDWMLQQEHQEQLDQNEFAHLHQYLQQEQNRQQSVFGDAPPIDPHSVSYGCEVLAFGRPNHLALGVQGGKNQKFQSSASATSSSETASCTAIRPQRIQQFGQDRVGREGAAVAVAAAAHHTLVATRNGHLYAFGVGTGGRLGTGESEKHCPVPTRVLGTLATKRVVAVAAAENHSLCVTSDGAVYAFGSNRFGQLGYSPQSSNMDTHDQEGASASRCCLPRRVDDLWKKNILCIGVAAGEKHSVALSQKGEVYVWGCNSSGQLGLNHRRSTSNSGMVHKVQRVDALWNNEKKRICFQIAASSQATLVLAKPNPGGLPVNQVYSWGHGNHVPSKVHFTEDFDQRPQASPSWGGSFSLSTAGRCYINPVAIACARFHSVAIAADGRVYTWGLHAEPLGGPCLQQGSGQKAAKNSALGTCSCPQLVTGMLPEEGGGCAVAVAASENHTAVVTKEGALFTWGATHGKDVLGHEGVRWQPCPKRVAGVSRAVGVAAAKEHTVLLVGTSFPPVANDSVAANSSNVSSLENLAALEVAKHVDLFNVLPILMTAERSSCSYLLGYCREFVRLNFDGVLNLGQKSVLNMYLNEELRNGLLLLDEDARDRRQLPLILDIVLASGGAGSDGRQAKSEGEAILSDPSEWIQACQLLSSSRSLKVLMLRKRQELAQRISDNSRRSGRNRPRSFSSAGSKAEAHSDSITRARSSSFAADIQKERSMSSSDRCLMLTSNMDLSTREQVQTKYDSLTKEIRGLKKRLNQIAKLEELQLAEGEADPKILSPEQMEKISRRTGFEAELSVYEPALKRVERCMLHYNLKLKQPFLSAGGHVEEHQPKEAPKDVKSDKESKVSDEKEVVADAAKAETTFRCADCKINCPDEKSYALHMNGRKHRNRMAQVLEDEKKQTAAAISEQRHRQQMEEMKKPTEPKKQMLTTASAWSNKGRSRAVQPKYKLPPPPHFPSQEIVDNQAVQQPRTSTVKSFREILEEEERKSVQPAQHNLVKSALASGPLQLPPGSAPVMKSPPWATKPEAPQRRPKSLQPPLRSPPTIKSPTWATSSQSMPPPKSPLLSKQKLKPTESKSSPWAVSSNKTPPASGLSLGSSPSLKSPLSGTKLAASFSGASSHMVAATSPSTQRSMSSFGDFLKKAPTTPQAVQRGKSSAAPWSTSPAPQHHLPALPKLSGKLSSDYRSKDVASTVKFQDIQKQQEEFKTVQDQSYKDNSKWFTESRERAGSFAAIQEIAKQEREHQLLVEEQKRIEEQIQRELALQRKKEEKKKRQKANKNKTKKGDSATGEEPQQHVSRTTSSSSCNANDSGSNKPGNSKDIVEKKQKPSNHHHQKRRPRKKPAGNNKNEKSTNA